MYKLKDVTTSKELLKTINNINIQYSTMPDANEMPNKIVQYVGETDNNYTAGYFYHSEYGCWVNILSGGGGNGREDSVALTNLEGAFINNHMYDTVIPADTLSVAIMPTAEESMEDTIFLYEGEPTEQLSPGNYYRCEWGWNGEEEGYYWVEFSDYQGFEFLEMPAPDAKYVGFFVHYIGVSGDYISGAYYDLVDNLDETFSWVQNNSYMFEFTSDEAFPFASEECSFIAGLNKTLDIDTMDFPITLGSSFVAVAIFGNVLKEFSIELRVNGAQQNFAFSGENPWDYGWEKVEMDGMTLFYKNLEELMFNVTSAENGLILVTIPTASRTLISKIPMAEVDGLEEEIANKLRSTNYEITLTSSDWTAGGRPRWQDVYFDITSNDNPLIDVADLSGHLYEDAAAILREWSKVYTASTKDGYIRFLASEPTLVDIPLIVKVIRNESQSE